MKFNERLQQLMQKEGLNRYRLAKEAGVHLSSISNWLSESRTPSNTSLVKLARYFNVSVAYLLGKTDTPEPPQPSLPFPSSVYQLPWSAVIIAAMDRSGVPLDMQRQVFANLLDLTKKEPATTAGGGRNARDLKDMSDFQHLSPDERESVYGMISTLSEKKQATE